MNKIGLLIIATAKYVKYIQPLIDSADEFFMKDSDVTYFLFTDSEFDYTSNRNIIKINKKHQVWPFSTLLRYNSFHVNREILKGMDYLFYCDVDMLFNDFVSEDILSDRVGVIHPGFIGNKGTPEEREISTAYIPKDVNNNYYCGGFNGGSSVEFLKLSEILDSNIKKDLSKNIVAIHNDESHLNRYFLDNPPTKILDSSYCYPESVNLDLPKRLIALDKNHKEIRTNLKVAVIFYHKNVRSLYKEDWWTKCIQSILNQTYKDFDIFEINYGADNESLIEKFDINSKLFFYSEKFNNHAEAMNFIIDKAFSEGYNVVVNTNLDDYYNEYRIVKQLDYIECGYDIVSSNFEYIKEIDSEDKVINSFDMSKYDIKEELNKDHNVVAHPSVCLTKKLWDKLKYNDKLIPKEDLDLWKRAINSGFRFKIVPEVLLHYRIHDKQVSSKKSLIKKIFK